MNLLYNFLLLFFFLYICTAKSADFAGYYCNADGLVPGTVDTLLSALVSGTVQNGFIATSYGQGKDQIYGLAQCRGDVSKKECSRCIKDAAKEVKKQCLSAEDARIWYDYCFLRYKAKKFAGALDTDGGYSSDAENVTDADVFSKKLGALMNRISSEAVKPASRGLGRGKSNISAFVRLYALVQCTMDLSEPDCAQCLAVATANIPTLCGVKRGCRVMYSSCYVRYELYPFFFPLDSKESIGHSSVNYKPVVAFKP